jgi:hypothetical protein
LRKQWSKIGASYVGSVVTLIYAMFLLLNLGFRSSEESIVALLIIPTIPDIVIERKFSKNHKILVRR